MVADKPSARQRLIKQSQTIAVCQRCGFSVPIEVATPDAGWLVSPWLRDPDVNVVRCPAHVTNRALRDSAAGRTNEWRQRMAANKDWKPPYPARLAPYVFPR